MVAAALGGGLGLADVESLEGFDLMFDLTLGSARSRAEVDRHREREALARTLRAR